MACLCAGWLHSTPGFAARAPPHTQGGGGGLRGGASRGPGPPPQPPDVSPGGRELAHLALSLRPGSMGLSRLVCAFLLAACCCGRHAAGELDRLGACPVKGPAGGLRRSVPGADLASRRGPALCAPACAAPSRIPGAQHSSSHSVCSL